MIRPTNNFIRFGEHAPGKVFNGSKADNQAVIAQAQETYGENNVRATEIGGGAGTVIQTREDAGQKFRLGKAVYREATEYDEVQN